MAIDPVAGPVLGGVASRERAKILPASGEELALRLEGLEPLKHILADIEHHTKHILAELEERKELSWLAVLGDSTSPTYLEKKGFKYQAIFTPVALTNVVFIVYGLAPYVVASLNAGWSFTPFPDKTEMYLQASGTQANVLLLATDNIIGVAI